MKTLSTPAVSGKAGRVRGKRSGFTLIELMVALALFLVVAGSAFSLFQAHAPLYSQQQKLSGLNIALRNAITQMQIDVVNAGDGYYPGLNIAAWPTGVTVLNQQPGGTCYDAAAHTYAASCFDTLNVITADAKTPPAHPDPGGSSTVSTDTSSILFVDVPPSPIWTGTAAAYAASFHANDNILVLKADGSQMAVTTLTMDGQLAGTSVQLQHNPTGTSTSDLLGITTFLLNNSNDAFRNKLGTTFNNNDWVLRLATVTYGVDASDPTDPKLTRTQGNGSPDIVADQIVGFKVGASLWSGTDSGDTYTFANYGYNGYDPSQIRSLRISLIGRTPPNTTAGRALNNSFDGGNYLIQGISIVINPRNLSMRDN